MSRTTASTLEPKVDSVAIRRAFESLAKQRWSAALATALAIQDRRPAHLAAMADTSPQVIDKILRGLIVPREYLRYSIAIAMGCEVAAIFPLPSRQELLAEAGRLGTKAA